MGFLPTYGSQNPNDENKTTSWEAEKINLIKAIENAFMINPATYSSAENYKEAIKENSAQVPKTEHISIVKSYLENYVLGTSLVIASISSENNMSAEIEELRKNSAAGQVNITEEEQKFEKLISMEQQWFEQHGKLLQSLEELEKLEKNQDNGNISATFVEILNTVALRRDENLLFKQLAEPRILQPAPDNKKI